MTLQKIAASSIAVERNRSKRQIKFQPKAAAAELLSAYGLEQTKCKNWLSTWHLLSGKFAAHFTQWAACSHVCLCEGHHPVTCGESCPSPFQDPSQCPHRQHKDLCHLISTENNGIQIGRILGIIIGCIVRLSDFFVKSC